MNICFVVENLRIKKQLVISNISKTNLKTSVTVDSAKQMPINKFQWNWDKSIADSAIIDISDWIEIQRVKLHNGKYFPSYRTVRHL